MSMNNKKSETTANSKPHAHAVKRNSYPFICCISNSFLTSNGRQSIESGWIMPLPQASASGCFNGVSAKRAQIVTDQHRFKKSSIHEHWANRSNCSVLIQHARRDFHIEIKQVRWGYRVDQRNTPSTSGRKWLFRISPQTPVTRPVFIFNSEFARRIATYRGIDIFWLCQYQKQSSNTLKLVAVTFIMRLSFPVER